MSPERPKPSVESTVGPLIAALDGRGAVPPWSARRALEAIGAPAVPRLIGTLAHGPDDSRWEAAKALETIADPRSVPVLVMALEDENGGVRWLAAEALRAIGRPAIRPLLVALVASSESPWLREGAHHVLRSLSTHDLALVLTPVVRALEGIAPEIEVMRAADQALERMEAPQPPSSRTGSPLPRGTRVPRLGSSSRRWRKLRVRLWAAPPRLEVGGLAGCGHEGTADPQ